MQALLRKITVLALSATLPLSSFAQSKTIEATDKEGNKISVTADKVKVQSEDGEEVEVTRSSTPARKWYWGNSLDAAIFSTSFLKNVGESRETTPLRFSMFFHIGGTYNYDFSDHIGMYTGLDLKNIGFIQKSNGFTSKHRIYALGVPVGIRIGNISKRNYLALGGGVDFAVNYKEKAWEKRSRKEKFNEWFSDRTPLLQPYLFAAYTFSPGISLKAQYYPNSFMNQDFTETVSGVTVQPYAHIEKVNLLLFSVGFDMHFTASKK